MKTNILFIVALISSIILSSCGHDSGRLIGTFRVIEKIKTNPASNYGFVILTNSQNDTIKVFVSMEEEYLNVKIGDPRLVGENRYGSLFLNSRPKRGTIGYTKILQKKTMNVPMCEVLTRGQDTILVVVADVVYYHTIEGDSIYVKKNRDKNKPHYFVE